MNALKQARAIIDCRITGEWNLLPTAFTAVVGGESWRLYSLNSIFAPDREHIIRVAK